MELRDELSNFDFFKYLMLVLYLDELDKTDLVENC